MNASWALHSSLYRRVLLTDGAPPDEAAVYKREHDILADVHRWGLHTSDGARLSVLNQLATLQHYGAPTRLIDISFNPWIGLWFAVEQKWENGLEKHGGDDARLFAVDVANRLINEQSDKRAWEDDLSRPWPSKKGAEFKDWTTAALAWRPAPIHRRLAAQNGGFLLGGVPGSSGRTGPVQWLKDPAVPGQFWTIDEVRQATSVALRTHKITHGAGRPPNNPVFSIRIKAAAKVEIRERLEKLFGYNHATIYPDYTGFASFGTPSLKSW